VTDEVVVLVSGDRHWTDYVFIYDVMRELQRLYGKQLRIAQGLANGVDTLAAIAAVALGIPLIGPDEVEIPNLTRPAVTPVNLRGWAAKWDDQGKAAGPIRNAVMLKESGASLIVAFHDHIASSRGTRNMLDLANKKRIPAVLLSNRRVFTTWTETPTAAAVPQDVVKSLSRATSQLHTATPPEDGRKYRPMVVDKKKLAVKDMKRIATTANGTAGMRRGAS
jgi:hypothetical protein